ncbi:MAG: DUF559 domain-containing protein [Solirubrobacterales bacterium]|nr:DUF559 domain-containing protein [Solirubrobacterales bacterium]
MAVTPGTTNETGPSGTRHLSMARGQHGTVSRDQLLAAGIPPRTISGWLSSGILVGVFAGTYATGIGVLHFLGLCMAATLTGPEGSVLSPQCGGTPWAGSSTIRDRGDPAGRAHPALEDRRPAGPSSGWTLVVHRSRDLPEHEITTVNQIRTTTPSRTLLDLAARESLPRLQSMVAAGERERVWRSDETERTGARGRGWKGLRKYRAVALAPDLDDALTESELELRFRQFCRNHDINLNEARVNVPIGEFRIDCVWEGLRLIVEVDSWTWHRSREAFERDRRRDAINTARGYRTVRVTSRAMEDRPAETADLLKRVRARIQSELGQGHGPDAGMGETGFEPV